MPETSRTTRPNKAKLIFGVFFYSLILIGMAVSGSDVPFLLCLILSYIVAPELMKVKTTWWSMTLLFLSIVATMVLSFFVAVAFKTHH